MNYKTPIEVETFEAMDLIARVRPITPSQADCFAPRGDKILHYAGNLDLISDRPIIAIVGTRNVSDEGAARARRLARELSDRGIVVMSGLAKGVDTEAMTAAAKHPSGRLVGVIGTPMEKVTPKANGWLQQLIHERHLLITPFAPGTSTQKHHFPERNKVMALLSDATVIVEASQTSGTIHQASECARLGRDLFFMRSMVDAELDWVDRFLSGYERAHVLETTDEMLAILGDIQPVMHA